MDKQGKITGRKCFLSFSAIILFLWIVTVGTVFLQAEEDSSQEFRNIQEIELDELPDYYMLEKELEIENSRTDGKAEVFWLRTAANNDLTAEEAVKKAEEAVRIREALFVSEWEIFQKLRTQNEADPLMEKLQLMLLCNDELVYGSDTDGYRDSPVVRVAKLDPGEKKTIRLLICIQGDFTEEELEKLRMVRLQFFSFTASERPDMELTAEVQPSLAEGEGNRKYYGEGDAIQISFKWKNTGDVLLRDISFYCLYGSSYSTGQSEFEEAGHEGGASYPYMVTAEDEERGYIEAACQLRYLSDDPDDAAVYGRKCVLYVPTSEEGVSIAAEKTKNAEKEAARQDEKEDGNGQDPDEEWMSKETGMVLAVLLLCAGIVTLVLLKGKRRK